MKPINRLKRREEGRRKEKTLTNEQVSQSRKKRGENGWPSWMDARGCRVGTEVDEEQGREGTAKNSRALCSYTRHWETHSNTFTHSHTDTVVHTSACLLPTAAQTCAGISEGSPISSPVLGVEADPPSSTSAHLTSEIEPPLLSSLPVESTEYLRAVIHNSRHPNSSKDE